MSAEKYFDATLQLIQRIRATQAAAIAQAAETLAESIAGGGWVNLFGSGHSVIPVLDVFPRYGSFVGFRPLMDPRLMWFNVLGPGGAPELLWLERREGYIENFLANYSFTDRDCLIVYSHGGLNAAPVEAALYVRKRGCRVIAVTCLQNRQVSKATHSSGYQLADAADIVIDNCVPAEDALVDIGTIEKVAAGSTLAVVLISMSLVAETATRLRERGVELQTFVSPNVAGVPPGHNRKVFDAFRRRMLEQVPPEQ